MGTTRLTQEEAVNALVDALRNQMPRPDPEDGWVTILQIMEAMGLTEFPVRRRLRTLNGKVERRRYENIMYYRIKP